MAKITDPDDLTSRLATDPDGSEDIIYDRTARTIEIRHSGNGGTNIDQRDGVTYQAAYSKAMNDWKNIEEIRAIPFPWEPIGTGEQFDMIDGWNFLNASSRFLLKDGGYALRAAAGANATEEWACMVSLGDFEDPNAHTAYWQFVMGGPTSTANQTGPVNELVQIYSDPDGDGDPSDGFDYRSTGVAYFKMWLREQAHIYDFYDLVVAQSRAELTYRVYQLPLANRPDLKVTNDDNTIDTQAPYTGMDIKWYLGVGFTAWANATFYVANSVVSDAGRWYYTAAGGTSSGTGVGDDVGVTWVAYDGERQLGANYYPFDIIVEGNNGTKEQIYEYLQRQLRRMTNINSGSTGQEDPAAYIGNVTAVLANFEGDTLVTEQGVFLDNLTAGDLNEVIFNDATNTPRTYPALATITATFSETLQNDANGYFHVYFTNDDAGDNLGRDYGTIDAITVRSDQQSPASEIKGDVLGNAQLQFPYEFDENVQRGAASAGTPVPLTGIASGQNIGGAAYVRAEVIMNDAGGVTIAFVAPQDRAYKT